MELRNSSYSLEILCVHGLGTFDSNFESIIKTFIRNSNHLLNQKQNQNF